MPEQRDTVRSRILEAAVDLLAEQGGAAVTTRGVADRAGLQPPAIYRHFGDKDGLLDAVAEHVLAAFVARKARTARRAADDDVDPLADLRAGWDAQLEFGLANPTVHRLLNDPGRALPSPAAAEGRRLLTARVHRLAALGRLRVPEDRAVDLLQAAGTGAVHLLLSRPAGRRDLGVADDLFEAVLRQVLHEPPARPDAATRATTIAFRALAPDLPALSAAERAVLVEWLDRAVRAGA